MGVFQFASPRPISPGEALLWLQQLAAEGKIRPDDYDLRKDRTMEGEEFLLVTSPRDKTERQQYETRMRQQVGAPLDELETFRDRMLAEGTVSSGDLNGEGSEPTARREPLPVSDRPRPYVSEPERAHLQRRGLHGLARMIELGVLKGPGNLTVKLRPRPAPDLASARRQT